MKDQITTRFAPSPTGFLHIGGARTALFNWLFARSNGGRYLLRIEDTDRERSSDAAVQAIFDGLGWLGLEPDEEPVFQASRAERHREIALAMLAAGHAYRCYSSKEEIDAFREEERAAGRTPIFRSPWRESREPPPDAPFAIRLKAPRSGATIISDQVQGEMRLQNTELDDLVLLRADESPTYMLAVVVDDADMQISHVIRGDDHLINAARQSLIYEANGWDAPKFAHIPLIHGEDGRKLSKRHGALGVEAYREMGFPAEAVCNYLARLGWAHGDLEYFTRSEAARLFTLAGINKSAARFDVGKLEAVSSHHIRSMPARELIDSLKSYIAAQQNPVIDPNITRRIDEIEPLLPHIREKAKTLGQLLEFSQFYFLARPVPLNEKSLETLNFEARTLLARLTSHLQSVNWSREEIDRSLRDFLTAEATKPGKLFPPIRAALTGGLPGPGIAEMLSILGREEAFGRIDDATKI